VFTVNAYQLKSCKMLAMRADINISGIVQGVGFRPFVYRIAVSNNLLGFVRNRRDATVQIVVQGKENNIKCFLEALKDKKPPLAHYDNLSVTYANHSEEFREFQIMQSSEDRELSGSVIPPDIAICDACKREMCDPKDRRFGYFFITCTDCGPRFSIIEDVPYDRQRTTMRSFLTCDNCAYDYGRPVDRRFHAQTVACEICGPKVFLTDNRGEKIHCANPISRIGALIEEGCVVAIKGIGGFHIAASTLNSEPISRLRSVKHRRSKPFAIMTKDLNSVRSFAIVTDQEEQLLASYVRPIVLLKKRDDYYLSPLVSPELHNVGVMLPYTALHHLLFDGLKLEPALVMTSANPPNEPIVKDNEEALSRLGDVVDYFLLHDRIIANRCDDSVVRINDGSRSIIRRSRGYVPTPIFLHHESKLCVLGLGAELNAAACVIVGNKAFLAQHTGDVENLEIYLFLRDSIKHLLRMVNAKPEAIACDLHPSMNTTRLAQVMGKEMDCKVIQIQHHHAHIASLMAELDIDEMIGIACDGVGYGDDGKVWGGEILLCDSHGYTRLGNLMEQPMVGGDLATYYPLRMVAGILYNVADGLEQYLNSKLNHFPKGQKEVELILNQLGRGVPVRTTSTGRILDAVSALLDICFERTYEGEPAMKLEAAACKGEDILKLKPKLNGNLLDTSYLLQKIYENRNRFKVRDLAYSAHSYLAQGLAMIAVDEAKKKAVSAVGFSGGVAYNEHITLMLKREIELNGLKFFTHEKVPPGDGGISLGQAYAASLELT